MSLLTPALSATSAVVAFPFSAMMVSAWSWASDRFVVVGVVIVIMCTRAEVQRSGFWGLFPQTPVGDCDGAVRPLEWVGVSGGREAG